MEKTVTLDVRNYTASLSLKDLPLQGIAQLPAIAKDIAEEITRLYYLQVRGSYSETEITSKSDQGTLDKSEE